jgi:hypothetical protein
MAPFSPDPSAQCRKVKTAWPSIELGTPRPFVERGHFGQTLYGRAKYMRSPEANNGQLPREFFVIQLREAKAEWRRRKPDAPLSDSI